VLWFFLQHLSGTFLILGRTQRYISQLVPVECHCHCCQMLIQPWFLDRI
jgi:hypothetical protein